MNKKIKCPHCKNGIMREVRIKGYDYMLFMFVYQCYNCLQYMKKS
jgi:hypothetical protein